MPCKDKNHDQDKDAGFSLVELMVVVLVIAVLLAIAIPTFLGSREKAQRRAAQSDVRNAYVAQQIFYAGKQEFTESFADLKSIDPSLDWELAPLATGAKPTSAGRIYYRLVSDDLVLVATRGENQNCYWIRTVASPGLPRFLEQESPCEADPDEAEFLPSWPD